jgi:hypothetical protein
METLGVCSLVVHVANSKEKNVNIRIGILDPGQLTVQH